jgi:hypothetical protein
VKDYLMVRVMDGASLVGEFLVKADTAPGEVDNLNTVTVSLPSINARTLPLCNYAPSGAPDEHDDETKGYSIGSEWIVDASIYKCTDATTDNAVWATVYEPEA